MCFWDKRICHSKIFGCLNTLYTVFLIFSRGKKYILPQGEKEISVVCMIKWICVFNPDNFECMQVKHWIFIAEIL